MLAYIRYYQSRRIEDYGHMYRITAWYPDAVLNDQRPVCVDPQLKDCLVSVTSRVYDFAVNAAGLAVLLHNLSDNQ